MATKKTRPIKPKSRTKPNKPGFHASAAAERELHAKVKRVGRVAQSIINPHLTGDERMIHDAPGMLRSLDRYGSVLGETWAPAVVTKIEKTSMLQSVKAWTSLSNTLGRAVRENQEAVSQNPEVVAARQERIDLITSIPEKLGQNAVDQADRLRAQIIDKADRALSSGMRAEELADQIKADYAEAAAGIDGAVKSMTDAKAALIARTEINKANEQYNRLQAQEIGVTHYVWRTMGDANVRDTHADMEGRVIAYDNPEDPGDGFGPHHPGEVPNCRCYAEPVIPSSMFDDED